MRGITFLLIGLISFSAQSVLAASPESEARLKEMKRRVAELEVSEADVKFSSEPLFRYSDPTRGVTDATMWKLGETGRPRAIMMLEHYITSPVPWNYELSVTSTTVPAAIKSSGWTWKPKGRKEDWTRIDTDQSPHAEKAKRGRQAKELIRKFQVTEEFNENRFELRLLPKSVARYSDESAGIVDGHIYVFAHGTNSELIVLLEAQQKVKDDPMVWKANYARLGTAKFEVKFNDEALWTIDFYDGSPRGSFDYLNNGLKD